MEWAMNHYGGNDDNIVDENGNVVPNTAKLNRKWYEWEIQEKEPPVKEEEDPEWELPIENPNVSWEKGYDELLKQDPNFDELYNDKDWNYEHDWQRRNNN